MSQAWITPRWWPRSRGRAVTGFALEVVVLPELNNWKFGRLESGMFSVGPVRLALAPKTIDRDSR